MNNSNPNYVNRNSNETNSPPVASSRAPGGHVAAGLGSVSGSNLSRPRLMKMRKHTSYTPRSSVGRREEESDFSLGFNPFRSSKKSFSFGAGSGSADLSSSEIVDDFRKMQIDSDNTYSFRGNVVAELGNEMNRMNLGNNGSTFVFGRNSKSDESLISDKLAELKVGGDRDDNINMKNFVFGSTKLNEEENVKDDLISDKMRELKVGEGGGGVEFVFGQNVEPKVFETTSSSNFQPFGNAKFSSSPLNNVDFTFSSKLDNFVTPNVELKKKKKGKVRKPVISKPQTKQDFVFSQTSVQNPESFEAYSPMDVSPYQETLADMYTRETSVKSSDDDNASQINDQNSVSSESHVINSNITIDEELIGATQRLKVNDGDVKCEVSEAETFISAMENLEYSGDSFASALDSDLSSTATSGKKEKTGDRLFKFGSKLENINKDNFTFTASTSSQGQHKKKHRLKTGQDSYSPTSDARNTNASSSSSSSILSSGKTQKVDMSSLSSKNKDKFKPINEQDSKHGNLSTASVSIAAEEACEKWRLRGNQAYGNGDLAKAEDYYTQGLNSVSETEKSKGCLRALMLCYSNRAATRISLGKMKDALKDCLMAAAIDPNFLKVQVRAAHCYLAIGEVEKASLQYMKCLQSGSEVCLDRKLLVEASEGLEKSQKVTECFKQYTELPRRTPDELESALRVIDEALQISSYSEQLFQMKADTLLMLRKFEQIIQLCEQTLSSAETPETPTSSSSWRSNLIVKSYFYLGRLEEAHEFIKKQETSGLLTERLESMSLESVIPLADTIRELLSRKAAGNEAYKSGKYAEAVEHYTSALSCSVESRPFAAICFCNRAAAYRSLGQIADAIADCSLAIALDPNYLKAISRRASLYEVIRDYGQAAKDLRKLMSLLTSQIDERGVLSGISDKTSGMNDLRQTQLQLYNIEEESRKEIPLNMYLILGVESTAAASEIKKAYRKAALKHHPDKAALSISRSDNGDDGLWKEIAENVYKDADLLFKMIGEAYAVLSNPSKRSQYDMDEEMRNEVNKYTRSRSGRMAPDVHSPMYERSGSRRWQDNSYRPFVNSQSKGQEKPTSSYKYSRQP